MDIKRNKRNLRSFFVRLRKKVIVKCVAGGEIEHADICKFNFEGKMEENMFDREEIKQKCRKGGGDKGLMSRPRSRKRQRSDEVTYEEEGKARRSNQSGGGGDKGLTKRNDQGGGGEDIRSMFVYSTKKSEGAL